MAWAYVSYLCDSTDTGKPSLKLWHCVKPAVLIPSLRHRLQHVASLVTNSAWVCRVLLYLGFMNEVEMLIWLLHVKYSLGHIGCDVGSIQMKHCETGLSSF